VASGCLGYDPSNGTRVAFEAQLASMTLAEGEERTARYGTDGITTFWVTTGTPPWLWRLPGFRIRSETRDGGIEIDGLVENDDVTPWSHVPNASVTVSRSFANTH